MSLTDTKIKNLCVPEGKKMLRVADSGNLSLLVIPSGKYWQLAYRFAGKQKTLSVGVYPAVSLTNTASSIMGAGLFL